MVPTTLISLLRSNVGFCENPGKLADYNIAKQASGGSRGWQKEL